MGPRLRGDDSCGYGLYGVLTMVSLRFFCARSARGGGVAALDVAVLAAGDVVGGADRDIVGAADRVVVLAEAGDRDVVARRAGGRV